MSETQGKKLDRCPHCGTSAGGEAGTGSADHWRDSLAAVCVIIDYTPSDAIAVDPAFKAAMKMAAESKTIKLAASMWERNLMLGFREAQRVERKRLVNKLRTQARSLAAIGDQVGEYDAIRQADWIEESEEADDDSDDSDDSFKMFRAKALVDFVTDFERLNVAAGTNIVVIDPPPPVDDQQAFTFIVEVAIPDETVEGGFTFDTAELKASEIERLTSLTAGDYS